jgi:hypothetical protein
MPAEQLWWLDERRAREGDIGLREREKERQRQKLLNPVYGDKSGVGIWKLIEHWHVPSSTHAHPPLSLL